MLVTFTNGTSSIGEDLTARCTWRTPAGGEAGEASVFVPYSSDAASPSFINPDGGSAVTLQAGGDGGIWRGIVTKLTYTEYGVHVEAHQPWILLGRRIIARDAVWKNVPTGFVAGILLREAVSGIHGMSASADYYEGGGPVEEYVELNGVTAWQWLAGLMNTSEGELHVDPETLVATWCGPFAHASVYPSLLFAGRDLRVLSITRDVTTRVAEVVMIGSPANQIPGYREHRADVAAGQHWTAQQNLNWGSFYPSEIVNKVHSALEAASNPIEIVEASVPPEHWGLRERAYIRVAVPWDGFTGRMFSARVLERTIDDNSPLMKIKCQVVGQDIHIPMLANVQRDRPTSLRPRNFQQSWLSMYRAIFNQ